MARFGTLFHPRPVCFAILHAGFIGPRTSRFRRPRISHTAQANIARRQLGNRGRGGGCFARQRISRGTLYAISGEDNIKVLLRFQFTDKATLPHLEKVLPVINKDAPPIVVQRFFLTASVDLFSKDLAANLSTRDWLITGHNPELVIRMAADL